VAKKYVAPAIAVAAALCAFALGAGDAKAGLFGCNYSEQQTFSAWGDTSSYTAVPGGSFETYGWGLFGGASIVSGNEPFMLGGDNDSHSLQLPPGASALSPGVCTGGGSPSMRFVGKANGAGYVRVDVYSMTLGLLRLQKTAYVSLPSSWDASPVTVFPLQNLLGLVNLGTQNLYFRFSAPSGTTVQLDDVYLDPTFCL
jgi:hypothetical protein